MSRLNDWDKMRTEYIKGGVTYRQLAKKYGVSKNTIGNRAKQEGWTKLRDDAVDESRKQVAKSIGRQQGKDLAQMVRATESFAAILEGLLAAVADNPEGLLTDLRGVESIAGALRKTTDNLRELYGIPTEAQKLTRERLQIERERWAAEKAAAAQEQSEGRVTVKWIMPEEEREEGEDGGAERA